MGWIIFIIVILLVIFVISIYNSLVTLRQRVKNAWSQIEVQLQRRFDLIPNLVETVKGYMQHEKETLEGVVNARNAYNTASTPEEAMKADGELTKAVSKLFALAEAYPDLKANDGFNKLQEELSETENKISAARQFYSDTVLNYNNKIQMIPTNIVAAIFGFKAEKYFEATESERENVKVEF